MSRRPRGDGALFFDNTSKCWVGRVTVDGTRHKVSAVTKSEARRKLADLRAHVDAGRPVTPGNLTVGDLIDVWFEKGLPSRNVATVSELPPDAAPSPSLKSMTSERVCALLSASDGTPLDAMWRIMAILGVRPGEAAGLS